MVSELIYRIFQIAIQKIYHHETPPGFYYVLETDCVSNDGIPPGFFIT